MGPIARALLGWAGLYECDACGRWRPIGSAACDVLRIPPGHRRHTGRVPNLIEQAPGERRTRCAECTRRLGEVPSDVYEGEDPGRL